jgi:uncharacterized integral membrane protein
MSQSPSPSPSPSPRPTLQAGVTLPENAHIVRAVQCPTMAKPSYEKYRSVSFVMDQLLPEALGYITGYQLTGMGNSTDKSVLNQIGMSGNFDTRTLGANYFFNTGTKCSSSSSAASPVCRGQDNYMYVRNAPMGTLGGGTKGLVSGILEDVTDVGPSDLISAFTHKGRFSDTCHLRPLPVGTSLDVRSKMHSSREAFEEAVLACKSKCPKRNVNCFKECNTGGYLESRCTSDTRSYVYGGQTYSLPSAEPTHTHTSIFANESFFSERPLLERERNKQKTWVVWIHWIVSMICVCLLCVVCLQVVLHIYVHSKNGVNGFPLHCIALLYFVRT